MNGFVLDQFFQQTGWRAPVDPLQSQKPAIEPRMQKAYFMHAIYLIDRNQKEQALAVCEAGIRIPPKTVVGESALGQLVDCRVELLLAGGKVQPALDVLNNAIELYPGQPRRHVLRAQCYNALDQPEKAIEDFLIALKISPNLYQANNNYAWLLATSPNERIANGTEAVKFATRACEQTRWKIHHALVTLAAASARSGDFENAIRWQLKGIELADAASRSQLVEWLELYKKQQPLVLE